jgi:hypothetical protein
MAATALRLCAVQPGAWLHAVAWRLDPCWPPHDLSKPCIDSSRVFARREDVQAVTAGGL